MQSYKFSIIYIYIYKILILHNMYLFLYINNIKPKHSDNG